ncbi:MAG: Polyphosphate:AMP phosphotransferase, partial [Devosia sp.]|nr:Polyphosphate:AMP phosphotransferase [Devosia sp.]
RLVGEGIWKQRFKDMVACEDYMSRNGIVPVKFFLNVSKAEQRKRLLSRAQDPDKHWKFSMTDIAERRLWDRYVEAYEDTIQHTATEQAPWHVVPADNKWFTRLVVGATIVDALEKLDPRLPQPDAVALAELKKAEQALLAEG